MILCIIHIFIAHKNKFDNLFWKKGLLKSVQIFLVTEFKDAMK